ncbi:PQQ-like beta-propeller repeat protein [Saccharopolyspora gregorii]|nr:PQQ-like beta-propeller repeat protein [Saccharopolyspora gregorii]
MFIGLVNPTPSEPDLTVAGVDGNGTTRWKVRTNPACAGFGVTRSGDRSLAVVLFSDADASGGKLATRTTASAFDVHTGRRAWGPVEVSGSLRGPGLTFGESRGERMVLSSQDGRVVAREGRDVVPHYEHDGTVLIERRGVLEAVDSGDRKPLWNARDLAAPASVVSKAGDRRVAPAFSSATGASDADVVALDWSSGDSRMLGSSLHDLRTGRQVADLGDRREVTTHVDEAEGVIVAESPGENGRITAIDRRTGAQLWQQPAHQSGLSLANTSRGIGYGTDDLGTVHIDLRTGRVVARGDWTVPEAVNSTGQMLVESAAAEEAGSPYVAFRA